MQVAGKNAVAYQLEPDGVLAHAARRARASRDSKRINTLPMDVDADRQPLTCSTRMDSYEE